MELPLGGTLMMDEDAASIVAQIKNLLGQLRIKGITDKEIDTILTQQQKPGRAYVNSRGMLVLPERMEYRSSFPYGTDPHYPFPEVSRRHQRR